MDRELGRLDRRGRRLPRRVRRQGAPPHRRAVRRVPRPGRRRARPLAPLARGGAPRVRAGARPRRVVLTGSECTGKTFLARTLAGRLGVPFVPEFVRLYAEEKGAPLDASDVEPVARGQMAAEDAVAAGPAGLVVLDTDLLSTVVYARHYYGACPRWVEEAAFSRLGDLYLLCHPDVPWLPDGVRDRGER
ncbi:ATP-binding protein, partial [Acidobacteria bacterium ACD]|nr:ATP-binding protein [Acidobacteria bacterium ACD]